MDKPRRIVVSNSTPLIYLTKICRLNIIRDVFERIFIPDAVFQEAVVREALNSSDAYIIEKAVGRWIIKRQVKPEVNAEFRFLNTNERLSSGEKEAFKLCKQLNAEYLIVDDKETRRVSRILNIKPIGTSGIILQACRQDSITKREALQILDDLVKAGFGIDLTVYHRILDEIGLSP